MLTIVRFSLPLIVAFLALAHAKTGAGQNLANAAARFKVGGAGQNLARGAGQNLVHIKKPEVVLLKNGGAGQGLSVKGELLNAAGFVHGSKAESFVKYAKGLGDGDDDEDEAAEDFEDEEEPQDEDDDEDDEEDEGAFLNKMHGAGQLFDKRVLVKARAVGGVLVNAGGMKI